MILCRLAHFNTTLVQNQDAGGEFQGGKNGMVNFQFQKPPGEFDERIRYQQIGRVSVSLGNIARQS